jgi:hypothetical protein
VYADPETSEGERDALGRWYGAAIAAMAGFFGPPRAEPPALIACKSDGCAKTFAGSTRRSRAVMEPRPMVIVVGLGPLTAGTVVHEMVHVEIRGRLGQRSIPAWFDDGVATFLGDNVARPSALAQGDLQRRRELPPELDR